MRPWTPLCPHHPVCVQSETPGHVVSLTRSVLLISQRQYERESSECHHEVLSWPKRCSWRRSALFHPKRPRSLSRMRLSPGGPRPGGGIPYGRPPMAALMSSAGNVFPPGKPNPRSPKLKTVPLTQIAACSAASSPHASTLTPPAPESFDTLQEGSQCLGTVPRHRSNKRITRVSSKAKKMLLEDKRQLVCALPHSFIHARLKHESVCLHVYLATPSFDSLLLLLSLLHFSRPSVLRRGSFFMKMNIYVYHVHSVHLQSLQYKHIPRESVISMYSTVV